MVVLSILSLEPIRLALYQGFASIEVNVNWLNKSQGNGQALIFNQR